MIVDPPTKQVNHPTPLEIAAAYVASGLSVVPIRTDGSKRPIGDWKYLQDRRPTEAELLEMFGGGNRGVGIIGGVISGNLEMLDFDREADTVLPAFSSQVEIESTGLMGMLPIVATPSGGFHVYYRNENPPSGNMKLARTDTGETVIETRGSGGYVVAPGSPLSCHPTGRPYTLEQGDLLDIPTLTTAERERLLAIARSFDRSGAKRNPPTPSTRFPTPNDGRPSSKERARLWLAKADPANSGFCGHPHTFATVRAVAYGFDLSESDAAEVLAPWNDKCSPPWSEKELRHKVTDALTKPFDRPRGYLRDAERTPAAAPSASQEKQETQAKAAAELEDISATELVDRYPSMRQPVIDGLLRIGETMNLIAAPKTNKSWLALGFACCVALGRPILGFPTQQGDVLIIDNELHPETLASRLRRVSEAYGIEARNRIRVLSLRGKLQNLESLGSFFRKKSPGQYRLVIIDAWYRALPIGTNENDNGMVAGLYNLLDSYADYLGAAFLLIHHTSKGIQSEKAITDVGAGAGSQSRAADTHLIMRPHEEQGGVVLEGVVRSFPPVSPVALRFEWPFFRVAHDLDPTHLAKPGRRKKTAEPAPAEPAPADPVAAPWTSERFAATFGTAEPKTKAEVLDEARLAGIARYIATSLLALAIERAQLFAKCAKNDARKITISNVAPAAKKPRRNGHRQARVGES